MVTTTKVRGLPRLVTAGKERIRGIDTDAGVRRPREMSLRAAYSHHGSVFHDFAQDSGAAPVQITGNRLEIPERHLAPGGIVYAPDRGLAAGLEIRSVGSRYLDERNKAPVVGFTMISAGIACRLDRWKIRVDGRSPTEERDPVPESDLGDAPYWAQPARRVGVRAAVAC